MQINPYDSQLSSSMEIDNTPPALYTPEQVEAITAQAIKYALHQVSMEHLDSSIPQLSPVITIAESAKMLRISKPKMYELIRSGQIHSINIGKKILVSRQSLLDWFEGRNQ